MIDSSLSEQIRSKLERKLFVLEQDIDELKELTKPVAPENAIGRISRMDAINNKSVNEAALRNALAKKQQLERALSDLSKDHFGICKQCGKPIETQKLLAIPESPLCISCTKAAG